MDAEKPNVDRREWHAGRVCRRQSAAAGRLMVELRYGYAC